MGNNSQDKNKKQLFIFGDLNALGGYGFIPLRNPIWVEALKNEYGDIHDGLQIWLFALTEKNGKYDPTVFPGVIRDINKQDEYEIVVDEKDMEYLSESTRFKGYTIEDVIGKEWYDEIRNNTPELL